MSFNKSIIEMIKIRRSVRTFNEVPISEDVYKEIGEYLEAKENLIGPFGRKIQIQIIPVNNKVTDKGIKIGTYGIIKNSKAFIVGGVEKDNMALVEHGYVFEALILYLAKLNLGTCWLGGTFKRDSFEKQIDLGNNEIIPVVSPVGYTDENKRFLESFMRFAAKSDKRKPWGELFFSGGFNKALNYDEAGSFSVPMEMVRLGPSASNKQPWRIVLSEDKKICHLYLAQTPNYSGNKMGFEMQRIDIGIAMCHFEMSCKELNLKGNWETKDPDISLPDNNMKYITSWITN